MCLRLRQIWFDKLAFFFPNLTNRRCEAGGGTFPRVPLLLSDHSHGNQKASGGKEGNYV